MSRFLGYHKICIFDYSKWAEPLREEIRVHAQELTQESGLEIDFIHSQKWDGHSGGTIHSTTKKKNNIEKNTVNTVFLEVCDGL